MFNYCEDMSLLQQGAEAKLYEANFFGRPCIVKERFSKRYRLPEIDAKLTRKRVSQEIRALQRCRKVGIHTPAVYFVDMIKNVIFLERLNCVTMREHIKTMRESSSNSYVELYHIAKEIGKILAKLHDADIIHGDLTTSNMMIKNDVKNNDDVTTSDIYLIDFGLSYSSSLAEDKGVDLYVLERAFLSTHPSSEDLFAKLLDSYKVSSTKSKGVIAKFDEVRMRGRKRSMVG